MDVDLQSWLTRVLLLKNLWLSANMGSKRPTQVFAASFSIFLGEVLLPMSCCPDGLKFEDFLHCYSLSLGDSFSTRSVALGHLWAVGRHTNVLFCSGQEDHFIQFGVLQVFLFGLWWIKRRTCK